MKTLVKISKTAMAWIATAGLVFSCSEESTQFGGETHWLNACSADKDCARGQCLCGICTLGCKGDNDCTSETESGGCFQTASPGIEVMCGSNSPSKAPGICLALCGTAADCPHGELCRAGACVTSFASDGGSGLPDPAMYADLDAAVDFSNPVDLPPPKTTIDGATDALVGTWKEIDDAGALCITTGAARISSLCSTLVFEKSAGARGVSGYVLFEQSAAAPLSQLPAGPFAPATNANAGYPTEVAPSQYQDLRNNETSGVRYRILDGIVTSDRLTFWHGAEDLWDGWCSLQTPYPVTVHGSAVYRCVPAIAESSNTDLGKLVLCRSALDGPQCAWGSGFTGPCTCVDGKIHTKTNTDWTCLTTPACACTKGECHADVHRYPVGVSPSLVITGDVLAGAWASRPETPLFVKFRRTAP